MMSKKEKNSSISITKHEIFEKKKNGCAVMYGTCTGCKAGTQNFIVTIILNSATNTLGMACLLF